MTAGHYIFTNKQVAGNKSAILQELLRSPEPKLIELDAPFLDIFHEEVFTHIDDDGTIRHFAPALIRKIATELSIQPVTINVEKSAALHAKRYCGVEKQRVKKLTHDDLTRPIIVIEYSDTEHMLIDGHHRYYFAWKQFVKTIPAFIIRKKLWERCLLNMPMDSDYMVNMMAEIKAQGKVLNG